MPHGSSPAPAPAAAADLPDGYRFELGDFAVDEYKPIRVIVIGAGLGGIFAGIRYAGVFPSFTVCLLIMVMATPRFPQKIPNVELAIYDKNPSIGGTWYNNRYP